MLRHIVFAISLWCNVGFGQQQLAPAWGSKELEALSAPCLEAWEVRLKADGRPSRDSTRIYCLCYDKRTRQLDLSAFELRRTRKRKWDHVIQRDQRSIFDQTGELLFQVTRERQPLAYPEGDTSSTYNLYRQDTISSGSIRKVTAELIKTPWLIPPDTLQTRWVTSTIITKQPGRTVEISSMNGQPMDSTEYFFAPGATRWSKRVDHFRDGSTNSATWINSGDSITSLVDSTHYDQPGQGHLGFLMESMTYEYKDSLLVRSFHVDHRPRRRGFPILPTDTVPKPRLGSPRIEERRYQYDNGILIGSVEVRSDEHGQRTTTYSHEDGHLTRINGKAATSKRNDRRTITHYMFSATPPRSLTILTNADAFKAYPFK